jgi:hypothetical protein
VGHRRLSRRQGGEWLCCHLNVSQPHMVAAPYAALQIGGLAADSRGGGRLVGISQFAVGGSLAPRVVPRIR